MPDTCHAALTIAFALPSNRARQYCTKHFPLVNLEAEFQRAIKKRASDKRLLVPVRKDGMQRNAVLSWQQRADTQVTGYRFSGDFP